MQIPPTLSPFVKGRENSETGGHALTRASESDSNPNKRQGYSAQVKAEAEAAEESTPKEVLVSRLIDRSPISSATQAALLALLSEPFAESPGGNSFAELVEEATLEQSADETHTKRSETPKDKS